VKKGPAETNRPAGAGQERQPPPRNEIQQNPTHATQQKPLSLQASTDARAIM